jgi:hypothetical protein
MENEIIKPIDYLPDYYVSNLGNIYSTRVSPRYNPKGDMRLVRPQKNKCGYLYSNLFVGKGKNKKRVSLRTHRIVAQIFIGNIPDGFTVDHLDYNKHNNRVDNLEIVSRSENILRYHRNLNKETVVMVYDKNDNFISEYFSQREAARTLNIHPQCVWQCLVGKAKTAGGYKFKYKQKK